jgi:hypothetical protein
MSCRRLACHVATVIWCVGIVAAGPAQGRDLQPACSQAADTGGAKTNQNKAPSANDALDPTEAPPKLPNTEKGKNPETGNGTEVPTGPTAAGREIEIGCIFEQQDRLDDAEKAYAKALETATGPEREDARRHLEKLLARKQGIRTKYLDPWLEKFGTSFSQILFGVLGAILVLFVLRVLKLVLKPVGRLRGRRKLRIGDFVDATESHASLALAEIMKVVVEEVKLYYKPRDRFLGSAFGSLVVLDSSGSEELVEIAAEVVPGGWSKLLNFITKAISTPEYLITGIVQKAGSQFSLLVKLVRNGATMRTWQLAVPASQLSRSQDDLALDVAMYLKEVVEGDGT